MLYWENLLMPKRVREKSSVIKTIGDSRSPFKKDFDTVCNSTVLRRLQDKAQVFPLEEEDYARSRLTHSIEVLSIAESLGIKAREIIRKKQFRSFISRQEGQGNFRKINKLIEDIPTILMAAALLHDMGNPPFGHLGEQIINDWFRENLQHFEYLNAEDRIVKCEMSRSSLDRVLRKEAISDLMHFDGNAQLLRLVTRLNLVVDEHGMNLTYPVMATFIKYPCSSCHINREVLSKKKAGYFLTETSIFDDIEIQLGLKDDVGYCRHPLAFLLEAADDIAYLTADIEDASHKGILSLGDIEEYLDVYGEHDNTVGKVKNAINEYKQAAIKLGYPNINDYIIHRLRIFIKGQMINAMSSAFEKLYTQIMNGICEKELIEASDANILALCLKEIETERIHYCADIVANKTRAIAVINKLLDMYVPAVVNYSKEKDLEKDTQSNLLYMSLSENYRFICEMENKQKEGELSLYNKLRLVIDQIAGMTDSRALSVYHTLSAI